MPQLSKQKVDKIQEQIIYFLYSTFPKQVFTVEIAREIARDEEFTKKMLLDLEKKELILRIDKNSEGIKYEKRLRWRISNKTYEVYSLHQKNSQQTALKIEEQSTSEQKN
ncbi:hypothetical protein KA107_02115 [Candidatus Pacearchaeota archaeon]|nr:hypothetical protein [Candidatus Pacearchaeota archaeon]